MGLGRRDHWKTGSDRRAGRTERIFCRVRVRDHQSAREPARPIGGGGESAGAFREIYSFAPRRLSFGDAARRDRGQSRARLARRRVSRALARAVLRVGQHSVARVCHLGFSHARVHRDHFHAHRIRRAGAEIHRDRESSGGFAAISQAIGRVLFPVQAGDLVTPQVFQFAFERHASDETDSGDRAGPQRRRVASHSGAEREIEGSLGARAQARAQRARSP